MLEELALRADGDVLAGGHRERAGRESRDARDEHDLGVGRRARDAEDQARVGNEAVVDAEHGGAQVASAAKLRWRCSVPLLGVGIAWPESLPSERAVYRHAAHLHGGEHALHAPRTEPAHEARDEHGPRVGLVRGRGRIAARRDLRAPDGGLRLGFAREALEELRANGSRLRFGARAVEVRRALLFEPTEKRIHDRTLSHRYGSSVSRRRTARRIA